MKKVPETPKTPAALVKKIGQQIYKILMTSDNIMIKGSGTDYDKKVLTEIIAGLSSAIDGYNDAITLAENAYNIAKEIVDDAEKVVNSYDEFSAELEKKADKLKIYSQLGSTDKDIDLISCNNVELRYQSTPDVLNFILADGEYDSDYMTSVSFATYDTPPQISYTNSGIINWVGTDCSLDNGISLFIPSPNMRYEIVVYFNGIHFVGLVNGYKAASGNVVNE